MKVREVEHTDMLNFIMVYNFVKLFSIKFFLDKKNSETTGYELRVNE